MIRTLFLNPVHSHVDLLPSFRCYEWKLNWTGELEATLGGCRWTSPTQITKWYYFNKWKSMYK